jgi:hypothetical protein
MFKQQIRFAEHEYIGTGVCVQCNGLHECQIVENTWVKILNNLRLL